MTAQPPISGSAPGPSATPTRRQPVGKVGSGYIPAALKREFVPEAPRQVERSRTDFRAALGTTLWELGTAIAVLGNWLRWEWLAVSAPLPYPDQVWGDQFGPLWENLLVLATLTLAVLAAITWWSTAWSRPERLKPRWAFTLANVLKWLALLVSGVALVGIVYVNYLSLQEWWMAFPGWVGQWFAQLCVFAGAAIIPSATSPFRQTEPEQHPGAWATGAAIVVLAIGLPWVVLGSVNALQLTSKSYFVRGSASEVSAFSTLSPSASAGMQAETSDSSLVWERRWRGAHNPVVVESIGGGTAALQLFQATPERPALVLMEERTGDIRASLSAREIQERSLGLVENPDYTRVMFTYGDTMLRAGFADEWVSIYGERLDGPPEGTVEETSSFTVPTDGVHAVNLVQGGTWFIGDSGSCTRRLLVTDGVPVADEDGTFVMIQVCNASAKQNQDWAFPEALLPFVEPLTATLFGVSAQSGEVVWADPLPGWETYLEKSPTNFPAALWQDLPFEIALIARPSDQETSSSDTSGTYLVSIDGHESVLDPATGWKE